jgi:hypothetical protein
LARAPALHAGGQGFDSLILHGGVRASRAPGIGAVEAGRAKKWQSVQRCCADCIRKPGARCPGMGKAGSLLEGGSSPRLPAYFRHGAPSPVPGFKFFGMLGKKDTWYHSGPWHKIAEAQPRKLGRAHGGCLGSQRRRRARQAAINRGEAQIAIDPRVPEWGNPVRASVPPRRKRGANPGN